MSKVSIVELPQKDRFDLPEVLKHLKSLGHKREDLFDFLRLGQLHAVCHPYRLEPDRQIRIEPDERFEGYRWQSFTPPAAGQFQPLPWTNFSPPLTCRNTARQTP